MEPQMDHMSVLDSMFLDVEDGITHMHIGSCSVFQALLRDVTQIAALPAEEVARRYPATASGAVRAGALSCPAGSTIRILQSSMTTSVTSCCWPAVSGNPSQHIDAVRPMSPRRSRPGPAAL